MIYREFVAWAFWNGKDAILKERLYGLSGSEVMAKTFNSFTIMAMSMKLSSPYGTGKFIFLKEAVRHLTERQIKKFQKDQNGNRPVYGKNSKLQKDPHFNQYILFYEYFHGDTGEGLGHHIK